MAIKIGEKWGGEETTEKFPSSGSRQKYIRRHADTFDSTATCSVWLYVMRSSGNVDAYDS